MGALYSTRQWRLASEKRGETALEYALIAIALAIAVLATVFALGSEIGEAGADATAAPAVAGPRAGEADKG